MEKNRKKMEIEIEILNLLVAISKGFRIRVMRTSSVVSTLFGQSFNSNMESR